MKILTYIGIRSAFLFTFVISYIEYKKGVDYMCNNENNTCENCIADILKVILILQQSVSQNDCCLETCDRGFLGQNSSFCYNTRPIQLYTCSGGSTPLAMPISKDPSITTTSTVFRLEKLDGCSADSPTEPENKDRSQNNVASHCQHGGQHRLSGITGGTHDIIQSDHYIGDRTSY